VTLLVSYAVRDAASIGKELGVELRRMWGVAGSILITLTSLAACADVGTEPTGSNPTAEAPTQRAAPPEERSCDPNYGGACVPIASDVDCAGGSGNGPAYIQGPVTVNGSDIYDLDRDGDGIASE
jgi:resuscitation-promoting factor RpfB